MLLPVMCEGVHQDKLTLERVVEIACENPAKIFGLYPRKGSLEVGADADIVLADLDKTVKVANENVLTRSGWTVLDGHEDARACRHDFPGRKADVEVGRLRSRTRVHRRRRRRVPAP